MCTESPYWIHADDYDKVNHARGEEVHLTIMVDARNYQSEDKLSGSMRLLLRADKLLVYVHKDELGLRIFTRDPKAEALRGLLRLHYGGELVDGILLPFGTGALTTGPDTLPSS